MTETVLERGLHTVMVPFNPSTLAEYQYSFPTEAPCRWCPATATIIERTYRSASDPYKYPYGDDLFRCPRGHEQRLHRLFGIVWEAPEWPSELPPVIDQQSSQGARDDAVDVAKENADPDWMERAYVVVGTLASKQFKITADDVWALIEQPEEPRALGAVFLKAKRNGLIRPTDKFEQSKRPIAHSMDIRVWESTILKG